jgi:hypothetical protein
LWAPVIWHPDNLYILRPDQDPAEQPAGEKVVAQKMPARRLRAINELKLADPWRAEPYEWLMVPGKLRPALVVSSPREQKNRRAARLMPLYKTTDDNAFYAEHEAEIRAQDIPGLYWLDNVPVRRSAPDSRVIDCARAVRFPNALLEDRDRIAVIDEATLAAIKQFWAESILV